MAFPLINLNKVPSKLKLNHIFNRGHPLISYSQLVLEYDSVVVKVLEITKKKCNILTFIEYYILETFRLALHKAQDPSPAHSFRQEFSLCVI